MRQIDTITALATPIGRSGIGILRVSGPLVSTVANTLLGKLPRPRQAEYLPFMDDTGMTLDRGIALFFPGPYSFTGEDILELQGHGSPVILDLLLKYIVKIPGVRIARPGEFSERAFLNNKLDLIQAEAIVDLINASSAQAARAAINSLQGIFSSCIQELVESLTKLRMYIEAAIDFPDEEIEILSEKKLESSLNDIISGLERVRAEAHHGSLIREGIKVVIAGKPNAGKSSLLNALARRDVAIVTSVAGTTRDILHEYIYLDGIPLHIIDTAGLCDTSEEVERIGVERAWNEIEQADHVLFVMDSTVTPVGEYNLLWPTFINRLPASIPITIIRNKIDLTGEKVDCQNIDSYSLITLSTKSGAGIDLLRDHLKKSVGCTSETQENKFLARRRHLDALKTAEIHLKQGREQLIIACSFELLAEELRLAQQSLSEITGEFSSNDLLSSIFSSFCVGK